MLGIVSERELWRRFVVDREDCVREELVRRNLPFAKQLALRYREGPEPFDDLLQVARLGLVNAIDRFDPNRGVPFRGFASPTILGELKRHFRDRTWTLRVPRPIHDLMERVQQATTRLERDLQRSPSVSELSQYLEVDPAAVLEVLEAGRVRSTISLERQALDGGEGEWEEDWLGVPEPGFESAEDRLTVESVLPDLSEAERLVLRLRFVEDLTQSEIAAQVGCSQMQVSRILTRILGRTRERVEELSAAPRPSSMTNTISTSRVERGEHGGRKLAR